MSPVQMHAVGVPQLKTHSRFSGEQLAIAAALCAVPLSIAMAEIFLGIAVVWRLARIARGQVALLVPQVFWYWLAWAGLEIAVWLHSPQRRPGLGEMRHLLLVAALFVVLPSVSRPQDAVRLWRLILVTGTIGSVSVIVVFVARLFQYRHELAAGGDPAYYLRSGGLLHHWMVYAVVEILVFAALVEFRAAYRVERRWLTFALAINCLAILLTLTRSLWIACVIVLGLHLAWRRSKWFWAVPLLPAAVFLLVPGPVHDRLQQSSLPDYYSNAERVQMLRVGWRMIRQHPVFGVGPGRVEELYDHYLLPGQALPSYHGHLHNNAIQLGAEFGFFVLAGAALFLLVLVRDLARSYSAVRTLDERLLCRCGLSGLAGFLTIGLMDYTYGHSLGLMLLSFAVIAPLMPLIPAKGAGSVPARVR
jgi:O-antigen ligase